MECFLVIVDLKLASVSEPPNTPFIILSSYVDIGLGESSDDVGVIEGGQIGIEELEQNPLHGLSVGLSMSGCCGDCQKENRFVCKK